MPENTNEGSVSLNVSYSTKVVPPDELKYYQLYRGYLLALTHLVLLGRHGGLDHHVLAVQLMGLDSEAP